MLLAKLYMLPVALAGLVSLQVPDPKPQAPPEVQNKINTMLGFGLTLVIAACVAGVLIVAGRMVIAHRRGELGDSAGGLAAVAAGCVLAGSASAVVRFFMF